MTYLKPVLRSYSALSVVQDITQVPKQTDLAEAPPNQDFNTDPAYQVDE